MPSKRVYVSGPLTTGDHWMNQRAAIDAAETLAQMGFIPFIPHTHTDTWATVYSHDYEFWMTQDFGMVEACDAILRLPGASSGADREVEYAQSCGIFVGYTPEQIREYLEG